ncbi:MAG: hypothetical protein ACXWNR_08565 [Candidatus Limnocylindrales bacterium]
MDSRRLIPPWLWHGFEAGIVGALLAGGTLVAFQYSRPAPRLVVPNGLDGSLILLPATLALGVFAVSYPTFMAATRGDAILGSLAAFLVAADALMLISLVARDSVMVHPIAHSIPLGVVSAMLALPVAIVALLAGQLRSPLGFGRSAGIRSAVGGAITGLVLVVLAAIAI